MLYPSINLLRTKADSKFTLVSMALSDMASPKLSQPSQIPLLIKRRNALIKPRNITSKKSTTSIPPKFGGFSLFMLALTASRKSSAIIPLMLKLLCNFLYGLPKIW